MQRPGQTASRAEVCVFGEGGREGGARAPGVGAWSTACGWPLVCMRAGVVLGNLALHLRLQLQLQM